MPDEPLPITRDLPAGATPPPRVPPRLRRPTEQLAGCSWLPRLVDKTRLYLAGTLPPDFVLPFCHPLATDGAFLSHFGITRDELIAAVRTAAESDAAVAAWFLGGRDGIVAKIQTWNTLAPDLGKPGFPLHRGFKRMLRTYYAGRVPDPRVVGVFTAIAYDEGYLDELVPGPEGNGATSRADPRTTHDSTP